MGPRPTARLAQRLLCSRPPTTSPTTSPKLVTPIRQCRCFRASPPRRTPNPQRAPPPKPQPPSRATLLFSGAGLLSVALGLHTAPTVSLDAPPARDDADNPELPRFRVDEIRKHDGDSPNPWVIHGNKVYDITDWVPTHPGGDVILRAAGGSIDRYWDIFSIHKNQYVYDILSQYLIGYVDPADLTPDGSRLAVSDHVEDPFADDPERHPDLITHTEKPRNAETPGYALDGGFLTPNELFYVRNHMWVPTVDDPEEHTLTVELPDGSTKTYTLRELKERFPKRTVTAVLQCSGNRRADMSLESGRKANGLPWGTGAISNAQWEGVLLADVLADAGFRTSEDDEVKHVHFSAMEAYGASIPIRKATDPYGDVLLAWGMNGKPLPPDHGFPLRSIVPGNVAARSVKWLKRITLSDEESPSQWQRRDYKCFGPNQTNVDWDAAPAIQEMPVQSAITAIKLGSKDDPDKEDRPVSLGGYAYSGGGRAIVRVDVSVDGGKTWSQAKLLADCSGSPSQCSGHGAWYWKRWRYDGVVPREAFESDAAGEGTSGDRKCTSLVVKATDEAYNTQPEGYAATWNVRGNLTSAWHRMRVCADCADGIVKKP
ncbi:Sulfite oxidase-like protein [Hapsidospora chrysogenum ATCC 11550]|uniref:Nitrate reductase [NADPH] n=1 Tax=Hapsidospora chrysogenum (strain ATCC 11550 / CBS 779.69 / DSM 880 / IAM 14645 / JCM 23072 / IMI 49137) TaxID=857340 RepID=A0A086ST14_HAPC1|nr:Sulfite oxidase-like protein [Hapsidospora chrysogenum ATCC 11550]